MVILEQNVDRYAWWASLKHGGMLISPSRLSEFFIEETVPLPQYIEDCLRRDVNQVSVQDKNLKK
jgi:Fe-S cluster biosynthesis and repair protein YggX